MVNANRVCTVLQGWAQWRLQPICTLAQITNCLGYAHRKQNTNTHLLFELPELRLSALAKMSLHVLSRSGRVCELNTAAGQSPEQSIARQRSCPVDYCQRFE